MTVNQYFNSIPVERISDMRALQKMIKEVFPKAVEDMSYKLPTYTDNALKICAIASQKNYMALYIMNYDLLEKFQDGLADFNCGKSCIRFKRLDDKTRYLFRNILEYIKEHIGDSRFYKR